MTRVFKTRNRELFKSLEMLKHKQSVSLNPSVKLGQVNTMLNKMNDDNIKLELTGKSRVLSRKKPLKQKFRLL